MMIFFHPSSVQGSVKQFDSWHSGAFIMINDFECPDEPDDEAEGGEALDD